MEKAETKYYFDLEEGKSHFSKTLFELIDINKKKLKKKEVLILCIGTCLLTGDSLGPLVGRLLESELTCFKLMGTIDAPVHALNLEHYKEIIQKEYKDYLVIAIDAALGCQESIGSVSLFEGSIFPGKGVGKELGDVGNISIIGIISEYTGDPIYDLQGVGTSQISKFAEWISDGISKTEKTFLKAL